MLINRADNVCGIISCRRFVLWRAVKKGGTSARWVVFTERCGRQAIDAGERADSDETVVIRIDNTDLPQPCPMPYIMMAYPPALRPATPRCVLHPDGPILSTMRHHSLAWPSTRQPTAQTCRSLRARHSSSDRCRCASERDAPRRQ